MSKNLDIIEKNIIEIEKNLENIKTYLNIYQKKTKNKINKQNTKKNKWSQFSGYCLKQGIPMKRIRNYYDKNLDIDKLISSLHLKI
jgi:hypothetical protein